MKTGYQRNHRSRRTEKPDKKNPEADGYACGSRTETYSPGGGGPHRQLAPTQTLGKTWPVGHFVKLLQRLFVSISVQHEGKLNTGTWEDVGLKQMFCRQVRDATTLRGEGHQCGQDPLFKCRPTPSQQTRPAGLILLTHLDCDRTPNG